eukprot:1820971-Pyramimonas_sp.AAC.1
MQLVRVTPEFVRQHREALQILTADPRHALNHCMLAQMRQLGVSLEFVDLGITDKATRFRVFIGVLGARQCPICVRGDFGGTSG